jgi:hypothetical protein
MPAGDRTGPDGQGPMTGRRQGYCAGYDAPGYAAPMPGRGFGLGGGRGRRWRHWFHSTGLPRWMRTGRASWGPPWDTQLAVSREEETETLKAQAEWLQEQLAAVNGRIEALKED